MAEEKMYPILYIIGTQSSGTTLFTRILLNDPKYYAQNELPINRTFLNAPTRQQIRKKLDAQFSNRRDGLSIDVFLAQKCISYWAFKNPQHTEYLPQLKLFSDTVKLIQITLLGIEVVNCYIYNM